MASKNVKVPGLCTLMLLLLGASLLLCQVSDAGTLRSDTCQGEADTDCGGSADPSGPSGLSAEESQKNKAEMPLFPSVVRRKAGEIWNEGKGGGRNE